MTELERLLSQDNCCLVSVASIKKALKQQPCEEKIIEWKKDFKEYINALSIPRDDYKGIMEYIDELPVTSKPCEDAISRADAINKVTNFYTNCERLKIFRHTSNEVKQTVTDILCDLPPVQPKTEIKPIGYRECSDAMLKMWMDNVLTDGEYYRIMDKLNAKWSKMNEVTE